MPAPIDDDVASIEAARASVREKYWQAAQEQYGQDQLADALNSLHIVDAVDPEMLGLQSKISEIESLIKSRKAQLVDQGRWAFEHGNQKEELSLLLRALALTPADESLRLIISGRYRTIAEAEIAQGPSKRRSEDLTPIDEYGGLPTISNDRINALFEEGLALVESDPAKARETLDEVLELDPTHVGARAYLDLLPAP